jgi:arylsulfatase A-like enzyme
MGRSMMHPDEVTLAEMLGAEGYRTGIFGKWHLGDNHPMRSIDQGFQESLVHKGGGMAQPSAPPGDGYFDPVLLRNGLPRKVPGYCTDIFTNSALEFIEKNRRQPFFCYLAFNAPHTPLLIRESYVAPFRAMGLDEKTARVYGMISNVDENVGKLLQQIRKFELADDTIVVFLTDNGPDLERYNAGMRGTKRMVYQGGIRVPCFMRWPRRLKAGRKVDRIAAHIDMVPTLLDACGVNKPGGVQLDGRDLMPLARGSGAAWPDRTLYFQWHRNDEPEPFRNSAARNQKYKLVDGKELYDLENDPGEGNDIAAANPALVARMRRGYEDWLRDVSSTRGYAPPRIHLGTRHENPVALTRQDWRAAQGTWIGPGYWEVHVAEAGDYEIALRFTPREARAELTLRVGGAQARVTVEPGSASHTFARLPLTAGPSRLEAEVVSADKTTGVNYVDVKWLP